MWVMYSFLFFDILIEKHSKTKDRQGLFSVS